MQRTTISPFIRWAGYLAWLLIALLGVAVLVVRSGAWEFGLRLYAYSGLASAGVLAVFALLLLLSRFEAQRGAVLLRALPAIPGAVLMVLAIQAARAPAIHDVTTDTADPPRFEAAPALRGASSNPLVIDPDVIEQQRAAYGDLTTLRSTASFVHSYNRALTTARELGWEISREDPNAGYIEAIATTPIMRFKDDVVIRVRTNADGSLVDVRSVSRVGRSDLGANARRIRRFISVFREAAGV